MLRNDIREMVRKFGMRTLLQELGHESARLSREGNPDTSDDPRKWVRLAESIDKVVALSVKMDIGLTDEQHGARMVNLLT